MTIVRVYPEIRWIHLIPECPHANHGRMVVCCSDDRFTLAILKERAQELGDANPLAIVIPAPTLALQDSLGRPFLISQVGKLVEEGLVWEIDLWEHIHCAIHEKAAQHLTLAEIVERQQHGLVRCQGILMEALGSKGMKRVNLHFADWRGAETARAAAWQQEEALQFAAS